MGKWYIPALQISGSRWHSANPASTSAKSARSTDQENTHQQPSFRTHSYCLEYSQSGLHSESWKEKHHWSEDVQTHQLDIVFAKNVGKASLTSFLLKTLEKLVDVSIRSTLLVELQRTQHAYRVGRSADTVLYHLKSLIEDSLIHSAVMCLLRHTGCFRQYLPWGCKRIPSKKRTRCDSQHMDQITTGI